MLSSSVFAFALSVLGVSAAAVGGQQAQPACVTKCWANSQYVSNCGGDRKCLCDDADFQNAMYQCLYSQCQTAQFGVALHHALALCSDESPATTSTVPAILRQGGDLRKRGYNTQSNSVAYTRSSSRPLSSSASKTVETITFTATDTVSLPPVTYTTVTSSGSSVSTYTTVSSASASTYTYTATFTTTLVVSTASLSSQSTATTKTNTRGSQSVSASAYQTYATSRAYPKGSAVSFSVLTVKPSAVTVSNSVSVYSSSSSSPTMIAYTSTVVVSAVPATSTATESSASSLVASSSETSSTGTSTITELVTAEATAYVTVITDGQVQAPAATSTASYLERRQAWDNQRYPADTQ